MKTTTKRTMPDKNQISVHHCKSAGIGKPENHQEEILLPLPEMNVERASKKDNKADDGLLYLVGVE